MLVAISARIVLAFRTVISGVQAIIGRSRYAQGADLRFFMVGTADDVAKVSEYQSCVGRRPK